MSEQDPTETVEQRLAELSDLVEGWLQQALDGAIQPPADRFGGMLAYHFGWRDPALAPLPEPAPGGKRLRSAVALLVCESVCGAVEPARHVAVALELLHNFSLVHDDIQDGSSLRRHRPAVWKLWGAPQGINTGDVLFALTQVEILKETDPVLAVATARDLNDTCVRLVEGQFLDLELQAGDVRPTLHLYEAMIARKTAALIACAARLGALCGRASDEQIARFGDFGHHLGMAFQEQDDLLGVWGTSSETGKPDADDVWGRKKGLAAVLALSHADAPEWLAATYRDSADLTEAAVRKIVAHFDATGIRPEAEQHIAAHFAAAASALRAAGGSERARSQLGAIMGTLAGRRS